MRTSEYLCSLSARCAATHRAGRARRVTYHCRRSSSTNASEPPGKAADHPRPARPTHPKTACEERECAPRSSSF
eukprot:3568084-Prymnesium_polylepis.1